MKVFLSWSDQASHKVACVLGEWLPYVIQAITPFVSSENILKGERWSEELMSELQEPSIYGIICLTRHNINAPWINFEAGAIAKAIHRSSVTPFLFHVEGSKVSGPLQQFTFTVYGENDAANKEEVFKLVSGINAKLALDQQVPHERLRRQFEKWWDELKNKLGEVLSVSAIEGLASYKWLFFLEDIAAIQARVDCKSVWVITSNLWHYSLDKVMQAVVRNNLNREVIYTYIIPDSEQNKADIREFHNAFKDHPHQPVLQPIEEDEFYTLAAADYIIVNPNCKDTYQLQMFLELPIESGDKYWIEVEGQAASKFVARFRPLAEGQPIAMKRKDSEEGKIEKP